MDWIEIKVMDGKDLKAFNFFQKLLLYVVVSMEDGEKKKLLKQTHRTPTDREGDGNPEWNQEMRLDLKELEEYDENDVYIHFEIRHEGSYFGDKTIGEVRVPLRDLVVEGETRGILRFATYEVRTADDKPNGVLKFSYKLSDNTKHNDNNNIHIAATTTTTTSHHLPAVQQLLHPPPEQHDQYPPHHYPSFQSFDSYSIPPPISHHTQLHHLHHPTQYYNNNNYYYYYNYPPPPPPPPPPYANLPPPHRPCARPHLHDWAWAHGNMESPTAGQPHPWPSDATTDGHGPHSPPPCYSWAGR